MFCHALRQYQATSSYWVDGVLIDAVGLSSAGTVVANGRAWCANDRDQWLVPTQVVFALSADPQSNLLSLSLRLGDADLEDLSGHKETSRYRLGNPDRWLLEFDLMLPSPSETRVFLSSQAMERSIARKLADTLRTAGMTVRGSPRNPLHGDDPRWADWYSAGLPSLVRSCDVAVIIVDEGWDSSTWMAEEARVAFALLGADAVFFWNPSNIRVHAAAMLPYLRTRLPDALPDALEGLRRLLPARTAAG
jgi:hypothetical protein